MPNPEIEYKTYQPDYTGMTVRELPYASLQDPAGETKEYRLDLILPEQPGSRALPVVFFVHGGGFLPPCDKRQAYISRFARALTVAGYAVVSPDYPLFRDEEEMTRCGGEACIYPLAGCAVHQAYQFLCGCAEEYSLDMSRAAIMGGSAGSMTAIYAAAGSHDPYRAAVNLWGVPAVLPDLTDFPPTLSVHGTADPLVPFDREAGFQDALRARGVPHTLIALEGEGHTPLGKMDLFLPCILDFLKQYLR